MDVRLEIAEHVRHTGGADGAVLLDLHSGKYFALNAVGSLLWEAIAAGAPRDEAVQRLAERFPEVGAERLDRDAGALLGQLQARGLLRPWTGAEPDASPAPPPSPAPASRPAPPGLTVHEPIDPPGPGRPASRARGPVPGIGARKRATGGRKR